MSETINPNARVIDNVGSGGGGVGTFVYVTEYGDTPDSTTNHVISYASSDGYYIVIDEEDLAAPSDTGLTFLGWYTTPTFDEGTQVTAGKLSIASADNITITFYAKWLKPVKTYMTNIANPIRNLLNTTNTLTIDNMNTNLDTTIAAVSDIKAALTEKGIDASGANTIGDVGALVSGIAGKYPNGTSWTQSNITNSYFYNCAYANGIWVASSETGIYYSIDGKSWTKSNIGSRGYFCAYANGIWVVGMGDGTGLRYSTDGMTWTQSNIIGGYFYHVANANGIWVACSFGSQGLYYSSDGMNWTWSNITSGHFYHCAYANDIWVACSYSSKGLYYSTDGKTWTQSNITSGNFICCSNANGIWVVCSYSTKGLYYSTDGKTWTQSNIISGNFFYCANANGIWVACSFSSKGLYYSIDGKTWTQSNVTSGEFVHCANANGIWVACSAAGLYYSTDGKTWTQSNIGASGDFNYCANANGIWVACPYSSKGLYYSVTWE